MERLTNYSSDTLKALAGTFISSVLPAMAAAHPSADFNWRGNTQAFAQEYAKALIGTGCTGRHIREAVDAMKVRSAYERQPPNAQEFKILCLQAKGMPTIDECIDEIDRQRREHYGKRHKEWSSPFVYWLNVSVAAPRRIMSEAQWRKLARRKYSELAEVYARNEIRDIPVPVECKLEPPYMRYLTQGSAS
tara:strand:- start:33335 stop:33907 length:573 start_codon:yes stop_codon:yes gene_type:complete